MRTTLIFALLSASQLANAQEWCTPGARWTYEQSDIWAMMQHEYTYVLDTFFEGRMAHKVQVHSEGTYIGVPTVSYSTEYTAVENGIIWLWKTTPQNSEWDTLYWFGGQIGDRWWPISQLAQCPPEGMLQISSFGITMVDGVPLSTVNVQGINEFGEPYPGAVIPIMERIGWITRIINTQSCNLIVEYPNIICTTYEDQSISYSVGFGCPLTVYTPEVENEKIELILHPNPGTTFQITGLGGRSAQLRVLDLLGRVVLEMNAVRDHDHIDTSSWHLGCFLVELHVADGYKQVLRWVKN
jgi:hypothetical protein